MSAPAIGIFDSGVGGLTVLKQVLAHLPGERIVYLGDTARLPYGTKSRETVVRYSLRNAAFLLERGVHCLVVACNTASALALDTLASCVPVPVVGVIRPGAERAARCTTRDKVGVIGTVATVRSGAYESAIRSFRDTIEVHSVACPLFVSLAEEGWLEDEITLAVARRYLGPLARSGIDVLVLGCTHYPLLKPVIARVMGPDVRLVDSAEEVPVKVERALDLSRGCGVGPSAHQGGVPSGPRPPEVYLTDCSPHFLDLSRRILGIRPEDVGYVDLG